jgi:hypothetical protein
MICGARCCNRHSILPHRTQVTGLSQNPQGLIVLFLCWGPGFVWISPANINTKFSMHLSDSCFCRILIEYVLSSCSSMSEHTYICWWQVGSPYSSCFTLCVSGLKYSCDQNYDDWYKSHIHSSICDSLAQRNPHWLCWLHFDVVYVLQCSVEKPTLTVLVFSDSWVDVVEWSRALNVRLSEWCCSVSMVWVQIPSREKQTFDSSKI